MDQSMSRAERANTPLRLAFLSLLSGFAVFAALAFSSAQASAANIYEKLSADPQFSTLVKVIDAVNAKSLYTMSGQFTVFAPTNDAFAEMSEAERNEFLNPQGENLKNNIRALLQFEIVTKRIDLDSQTISAKFPTYQKSEATLAPVDGELYYGPEGFGGPVMGPAINASNGQIVPIGGVPMPVFSDRDIQ